MASACATRCFFFGQRPDNKATVTFENNTKEPVQILLNGRVIAMLQPAPGPNNTRRFQTTIGQTFEVRRGQQAVKVKVVKKNEVVFISDNWALSDNNEIILYPLAHNRDVSGLRSIEGKTAATITFVNDTANDVNVDWINYEGLRQRYKTLKPGESHRQATFVTHPWEVVVGGRATRFLPTATAEYTAIIGSTDNPTLIRLRRCESENLRAGSNGPATSINFFNDSTSNATVSWIDAQGKRQLYRTLKPGEGHHQHTFINHPWEVVAGQNTTCYMPIDSEADVCIE